MSWLSTKEIIDNMTIQRNNINTDDFKKYILEVEDNIKILQTRLLKMSRIFPVTHKGRENIIILPNYKYGSMILNSSILTNLADKYPLNKDIFNAAKIDYDKTPIEIELLKQNNLSSILVSIYGTNILRKYIPNFQYIYGFIDNGVNKISICEQRKGEVTLGEYVKYCSKESFIKIYLQILFSLNLANWKIDYTHYDLTPDNIIVYDNYGEKKFFIKYFDNSTKKNYFLHSKDLAMILPGDKSFMRVYKLITDKFNFIGSGDIDKNIYPDRSFVVCDAYKIFMMCMNITMTDNKELLKAGANIYKFFNDQDDFKKTIYQQESLGYTFPYMDEIDISISYLIEYIIESFPEVHIRNNIALGSYLLNPETLIVEKYQKKIPTSLLSYYDDMNKLYFENALYDSLVVCANFDIEYNMASFISMIQYNMRIDDDIFEQKIIIDKIKYLLNIMHIFTIVYDIQKDKYQSLFRQFRILDISNRKAISAYAANNGGIIVASYI